jgi:FkbM family methyltransferase
VVAFEPQQTLYHALNANLLANRYNNVTSLNIALGAQAGEATMWPLDYERAVDFGGARLSVRDGAFATAHEGETMPMQMGDSVLAPFRKQHGPARFIKIDVESNEMFVARGLQATLKQDRPAVFCTPADSEILDTNISTCTRSSKIWATVASILMIPSLKLPHKPLRLV